MPGLAIPDVYRLKSSRHPAPVRISHWITAVSFLPLLVSGIAILLAHPRLYWGETGAVGAPSLIDLPLPFMLTGQSGWGRSLHFLSAWICVLTGVVYVVYGLSSRHFDRKLLPADLGWRSLTSSIAEHLHFKRRSEEESENYNVLQQLTYLAVIFVLFPLVILTGLAMSPAITSVLPVAVDVFGGQQSARTIHFFVTVALVLFLLVHLAMICLAGFTSCMRAMITGYRSSRKEHA